VTTTTKTPKPKTRRTRTAGKGKALTRSRTDFSKAKDDLSPNVENFSYVVAAEHERERSKLSDIAFDAARKAFAVHSACTNISAVAIEIPDLPDDVTEMYRLRAELAGVSLSSYLRDCLITTARWREKAAAMATVRETLAADSSPGTSWETIDEIRREMRGE